MDDANRAQAELWNESASRGWAELSDRLDRLLEPFVPLLLDEIGPVAGQRILDVGCGAGAVTLAAARAGGLGLGIDLSEPLIEAARARAGGAGPGRAEFVRGDAQTFGFAPAAFDAIVSRFGVMFFADPEAAFGNLHRAAATGASLACLAWRGAGENDFMTAAERACADLLPQLARRDEKGPGQFGFADPDRVRAVLGAGGWKDAAVRAVDVACSMPEADLALYARRMGPVGQLLPSLDEALRAEVDRRLDSAFRPFVRDGAASFTAACWRVTARA